MTYIKCRISTPQFRGSRDNFWMYKQRGIFCIETLKFTTKTWFGHDVWFSTLDDFVKAWI
jgi:hypothetical protein